MNLRLALASRFVLTAFFLALGSTRLFAPPAGFNYDEANVGPFSLPDPLQCKDGVTVKNKRDWMEKRRPEIIELFQAEVFGKGPAGLAKPAFDVVETDETALEGIAIRRQVFVWLLGTNGGPRLDLLMYIPNKPGRPVGAFLSYNFGGNHTVTTDPRVFLTTNWISGKGAVAKTATEADRGSQSSRWPISKIVSRGYAVITAYYGDVEPDFAEGWRTGVRGVIGGKPEDWSAIGAWAWGLSRAMDYLETDPRIDARRVIVMGHSRLGKTALWAGGQDERFAAVISNESGEGGAALARRNFGETTERINTSFPHWFCGNYKKYNGNEAALPVDSHMLIALSAPRPVYVSSAQEDLWADPKGEFLGLKNAEPVFALFNIRGLPEDQVPPVNKSVGGMLAYHIRSGPHDVRDFDWDQYLSFADRNLKRTPKP